MTNTRTTTVDATDRLAEIDNEVAELNDEIEELVERAKQHGLEAPADPNKEWSGDPSDEPDDRDYETIEERHDAKDAERVEREGERDEFVEALVEWSSTERLRRKVDGAADDLLKTYDEDGDYDAFDVVRDAKRDGVYEDLVDAVIAAGDGAFEIKRLTWGENNEARDRTAEVSYDYDAHGNVKGVPKEGVFKVVTLRLAVTDAPTGAPSDPQDYTYAIGDWLYDKVNAYNTRGETDMGNTSLRDKLK